MGIQSKLQQKPIKFSLIVVVVTVGVVWVGSVVFSADSSAKYDRDPSQTETLSQARAAQQLASTTSDAPVLSASTTTPADVPTEDNSERDTTEPEPEPPTPDSPPAINHDAPFSNLQLEAQSAVVWHSGKDRAVWEYNAEDQLPPASLTKVMTALVASEYLEPDTLITLTEQDLSAYGSHGLYVGEQWRFADLRAFMLMESSNDAAQALARVAQNHYNDTHESDKSAFTPEVVSFTSLMNQKAKEIGLTDTYFLNSSGLDLNEQYLAGSYATARDMAQLMSYIVANEPNILEPTTQPNRSFTSVSGTAHYATNTNTAIGELDGLLGSKTGYTVLAGGNLVVAVDAGAESPVVITVLGSSRNGRFNDVLTLYRATEVFYDTDTSNTADAGSPSGDVLVR